VASGKLGAAAIWELRWDIIATSLYEVIMDNELIPMLTLKETAQLLRVSEPTLRYWRRCGTGPAVTRLGPLTFRYSLAELTRYLDARRVNPFR